MSSLLANLAAAPFVNKRPVQRFTLAAWVVGLLLAAVNVLLWLQYRHDSTALRARLAETRSAIEARSVSVVGMDRELAGFDLPAQNAQVEYLNRRIAERTFPWSLLFERIASTLPDGVRLVSLNPVFRDQNRRPGAPRARTRTAPGDELVGLKILGVAKSDQELYELIDTFFTSAAFERPRLYQEAGVPGEVTFTVDVEYRPRYEAAGRPPIDPSDPEEDLIGPPHGRSMVDSAPASHQPAAAAEMEGAVAAAGEVAE